MGKAVFTEVGLVPFRAAKPGGFERSLSDELARSALGSLALLALGEVAYLTVFEDRLHLDFAAAGAEKALSGAGGTRVLGLLCHGDSFSLRKIAAWEVFVNLASAVALACRFRLAKSAKLGLRSRVGFAQRNRRSLGRHWRVDFAKAPQKREGQKRTPGIGGGTRGFAH